MRRPLALALVLLGGAAGAAAPDDAAAHLMVSTVRCRTRFGISQPATPRVPRTVTVLGRPRSTRNLAAYTNTDSFLIAPAGMSCSGVVAADGGSQLLVWSRGHRTPRAHSHGAGLSLTVDPACAGCRAEYACPFFASLARSLGFPCRDPVPIHERVEHIGSRLALFEDPPGVAGDGWPSGGRDPANGIAGITIGSNGVFRSTCTLPAREHQTCTISLNDAITRLGSPT